MTFLPIVDRELRVAARRRGTHWTRLFVAFFAILAGVGIFLYNFGAPPQVIGQNIFIGLAVICMIYCVASGRISTADCLSQEKREGTLGLLFLTDLRGYDIVLGKLVSTSLGALYGLLAVLPVLAVPLLMGGVTAGEFWRVVLVLVDSFLFSLAIGIFGSAISRDAHRTLAANFALLLLFLVVVPLALFGIAYLIGGGMEFGMLVSCPFYAFYLCHDDVYKIAAGQYWASVGIIGALTFLLLAVSCRIVPRTWQDKPPAAPRSPAMRWRVFWRAWSYGRREKLAPFRKRLLDVNAYYWLVGRARLKPLHVWVFLGLLAFWWTLGWLDAGTLWFDPVTFVTLALILNTTLKAWIAVESGQQLVEDQRVNALELVLATPLTARDIVAGHFLALRRQFLKPLALVIAVELFMMVTGLRHATQDGGKQTLELWLAGIIMLTADVLTLPLVAMRVALTAKNPTRATLNTVTRILLLPWLVFGLLAGITNVWIELFTPLNQAAISPGFPTYLALWLGVGIAVDLLFGLRAWRQLTRHFRSLATRRFAPGPDAQKAARRPRRPASRKKKAIWIGSVLFLAAVAAIFAWRSSEPALPAPVVLTMTQSNAPLRVFPGPTTFFILPDGTLWRWGGTGKLRATVPQQIGGDHDWLQISGNDTDFMGLRKDGTLWKWLPEHFGDPNVELMQVDSGRDWVAAGAGIGDLVALKKDGTLWDFDMYAEFANQGRQKVPGPVQIGTNSDWKSVIDVQGTCLALKVDGTIWIWGLQLVVGTGVTYIPEPTQLCRETNWVEIGGTFGDLPWARNKSGELWQLSSAYSGPNVPVSAFGQLLATDDRPGRLAYAFVGAPQLYQLRDDGTLWQKSLSLNAQSLFVQASDDAWQRVGKRNDWVTLWSGNGTAFGMTADGAVWTWGQDWTRNGTLSASDKLKLLQARTKQSLQNTPGGLRYQMLIPAVQKTPRPLFRLRNAVPAGSDTNAAGTK